MTDGAVPGNQNGEGNPSANVSSNMPARTPRTYGGALNPWEQADFDRLRGVEGIDDEITLLRVKLRKVLKKQPNNTRLITATATALARLVKMRYSMTDKQSKGLKEAITNVFREVAIPLGVNIGTEVGKHLIKKQP